MVQGQVFLKGRRADTFPFFLFSRFIIFTFTNYFTLCKIVLCIWRKIISVTIILWKMAILSCLKMNLKISHKLRYKFVKGFKRLKLIFDRKVKGWVLEKRGAGTPSRTMIRILVRSICASRRYVAILSFSNTS